MNKQWLTTKYITEDFTLKEIGDMCNRHWSTIKFFKDKFNIKKERQKEQTMHYLSIYLPLFVIDVLKEYCMKNRSSRSATVRNMLIEHLIKEGYNPFRGK